MSVIVRQCLSHSPTNVLYITILLASCTLSDNHSLVKLFNLCYDDKTLYDTDFIGSSSGSMCNFDMNCILILLCRCSS